MSHRRIEIRASPALAMGLSVTHLGAAAAIWCAPLPVWLKAGLTLAIGAALGWSLYSRAALRAAASIVALEITAAGRLSVVTRGGIWHACELLGTTYVAPGLTIVNVKPAGRRLARHVVLVPDNMDGGEFRRLRAWLRWAARTPSHDAWPPENGGSM